jgi:hypothetical protein
MAIVAGEDTFEAEITSKDKDLRRELLAHRKVVEKHYDKWDTVAKEDYKFALGDQWTEEERNLLKEQSRPCLTFNRIRPLINVVSGYQRENSARIKVNPEGGEDRIFSEVMDRGIKHVDKRSHLTFKFGYWFDDGLYCGKGWLEAIMTFDHDPIRGELRFKQRSPYQIKADPDNNEYDLNEGANYVFKFVRLSRSKIKELYPGKSALIGGFVRDNDSQGENGAFLEDEDNMKAFEGDPQDDDYGNDIMTQSFQKDLPQGSDGKFTVTEYWRPKKVTKYFVINREDGQPDRFDTKEEAEKFAEDQGGGRVIDRKVNQMWVASYCCGFILDDSISPFEPYYSGYPFFRFLADWAPNAPSEELRVQGMTRPLKDPQREKNKAKSQYLHITNTQANSGWIGDEDALTPKGWEKLEELGSKPGITVKKKAGKELREIQPKLPNQSHALREQQADEEFKQISNVNPDLFGS